MVSRPRQADHDHDHDQGVASVPWPGQVSKEEEGHTGEEEEILPC